ncbi:hypothetical protein CQA20_29265, partial [Klebsiella pneumoniae]
NKAVVQFDLDRLAEATRLHVGATMEAPMRWCKTVSDRKFDTTFVKDKTKLYKFNINNMNKAVVQFDLDRLAEATRLHVGATMEAPMRWCKT